MADTITPVSMMAFTEGRENSNPPQATVSLFETSLENGTHPASPASVLIKDEDDDLDGQEDKKPTKKRKSWGQELPTPKTNLPPRKRAKTEDEKEQRRIERVLRNRQAAQSSRERKRQEVEKLEGEKSAIERQNDSLKERLMAVEHEKFLLAQKVAKMTAQMKTLRQESGTSSPEPTSPALEQFDHQKIKRELDNEYSFIPTPELSYSGTSFASPSTMTYSPSQSPATAGLGLDSSSLTTSPDMTQHPAAMLCDLQCQSPETNCRVSSTPLSNHTTRTTTVTPSSSAQAISLILISAVYSQLTTPLEMIYSSLKKASPPAIPSTTTPMAKIISPSREMVSPLIQWLISTPAPQTPTTTATSKTTTRRTTSSMAACSRTSIPRPTMLQHLLLSSPSLARPLRAATGRTLRLKTSNLAGSKKGAYRIGGQRAVARNGFAKVRLSGQDGVRQREQRQTRSSRITSPDGQAYAKALQRKAMSVYSKRR